MELSATTSSIEELFLQLEQLKLDRRKQLIPPMRPIYDWLQHQSYLGYNGWHAVTNPKKFVKLTYVTFLNYIKFSLQRMTRGWSDRDAWNADQYITKIIRDICQQLKDTTHGYPADTTFEEWQVELQTVVDAMDAYLDMDVAMEDSELLTDAIKFEKGMQILTERMGNLWD